MCYQTAIRRCTSYRLWAWRIVITIYCDSACSHRPAGSESGGRRRFPVQSFFQGRLFSLELDMRPVCLWSYAFNAPRQPDVWTVTTKKGGEEHACVIQFP